MKQQVLNKDLWDPGKPCHPAAPSTTLAGGLGNTVAPAEVALQPIFFTQQLQTEKLEINTGTNSQVILQPVIALSQMETNREPLPGRDCNRSDGKDH